MADARAGRIGHAGKTTRAARSKATGSAQPAAQSASKTAAEQTSGKRRRRADERATHQNRRNAKSGFHGCTFELSSLRQAFAWRFRFNNDSEPGFFQAPKNKNYRDFTPAQ